MLTDLILKGGMALLNSVFGVIDQVVEDKDKAAELKGALQDKFLAFQSQVLAAATQIITTEAQGNWLQRNWRPLVMVTFVGLVVAKWMGFTAPGVTEAIEIKLLDIVEIGLGGYVIGRSVEKVAPAIAEAFKK